MKKTLTSTAIAAMIAGGLALAPTANAAEGGNDTRGGASNAHSWVKISRAELQGKTVDQVVRELYSLRGVPGGSSNLVVRIVGEKMAHPNANGYWAENYYNTRTTRSGVW